MARVANRRIFKKIKNDVLGAKYELSIVYLSPQEMRETMKYKKPRRAKAVGVPIKASGKNKISNVLAFPLSKNSGEILICRAAAKPYTVEYLFIHGLLHLKGMRHSGTMEHEEDRLLRRFRFRRNA